MASNRLETPKHVTVTDPTYSWILGGQDATTQVRFITESGRDVTQVKGNRTGRILTVPTEYIKATAEKRA